MKVIIKEYHLFDVLRLICQINNKELINSYL